MSAPPCRLAKEPFRWARCGAATRSQLAIAIQVRAVEVHFYYVVFFFMINLTTTIVGKSCGVNKTTKSQPSYPDYYRAYSNQSQPVPVGNSQTCATGTHFPVPCPKCYGQALFGSVQPRNMWAIVDEVHVPNVTGDFVLRWRWDTEQVCAYPFVLPACLSVGTCWLVLTLTLALHCCTHTESADLDALRRRGDRVIRSRWCHICSVLEKRNE